MDPDHILAAVSGGVDSSIAAHLAQQQGARVEGLTLLLPRTNVDDAAGVCRALGIPHHVGDLGDAFERHVVQPFVDDYAAGRTPNPCVLCNPEVKFRALVEWADRLGCGRIVTGHYARVEMGDDGPHLMRGVDARKDQSYMLYRLDRGVLERLWLPLGERRKREVRALARELLARREEAASSRRRGRRAGFGCSVSRSSYAARRVYVPGRYQMCSVRVWVPGSVIQEWIPARYETRYDSCGLPQSYLVRAGFYTTRQNPGHYETRSERRWVAAHWNSR